MIEYGAGAAGRRPPHPGDIQEPVRPQRPDEGPTGPRRQDRGDTHGDPVRGLESGTGATVADSLVEARRRLVGYYESDTVTSVGSGCVKPTPSSHPSADGMAAWRGAVPPPFIAMTRQRARAPQLFVFDEPVARNSPIRSGA